MNTLFANIYIGLSTVAGKLRREEKGATAVEYGIMVALIAVAIIGMVTLLGTGLSGLFEDVKDKIPTIP
ncbi:Flp family type IVb pilin [Paeniglutamicibacter sulfureus]|uniref:Pilus assembly protein Flp/PilA n=1 Tax=Paeniglutamicibacter sulfureus TaxID=43666 RepID=A0ABU2BG52_9MICC|nr:Flp family type IVb pilin [Paeniglutamicibacter sulfureus]MDR7357595.1 pilus assembly protein Flp/PilA [Paeniglutamicibacter sulfureus]